MKSKIQTIIILLILCSAPLTFGEEFYGLGAGINIFTDHFPQDNYSDYYRNQISTNFITTFYYFPTDYFLGLYARASFGSSSLLTERNAREEMKARKSDVFEFRAAASPSFRLRLGAKIQLPFSIGPVLIYTNEKTSERTFSSGVGYSGAVTKEYNYHSISGGINGDIALMLIPSRHFYLRPGISMDYIFLRTEKGEMRMNYRATHNNNFTGARYSAFNFSLYFGLGLRF